MNTCVEAMRVPSVKQTVIFVYEQLYFILLHLFVFRAHISLHEVVCSDECVCTKKCKIQRKVGHKSNPVQHVRE